MSELFILAQQSVDFDINKLKNDYQFFLNEILGIKNKQNELQKAITIIITQNDHLINDNRLLWQVTYGLNVRK
jgi:heat shock transcription factor